MIKAIIKRVLPETMINNIRLIKNQITRKGVIRRWRQDGSLGQPPHEVKQITIEHFKKKFRYSLFVETGTYNGAMVEAQRNNFSKIISVEISEMLHKKAVYRFRNYNHITILQGDSSKVLSEIISKINEPAIFWLDGHYSGGYTEKGELNCPVYRELEAIFIDNKYNHVLLIDDARCFNGKEDYPTIEGLTNFILQKNDKYHIEIKDDIIRAYIENV